MISGPYALSYCGTVVRTDELYSHYAAPPRRNVIYAIIHTCVCYYVRNSELASAAYVVNYARGRVGGPQRANFLNFIQKDLGSVKMHVILLS